MANTLTIKNSGGKITGTAELDGVEYDVNEEHSGKFSRSFIISNNGTRYLLKLLIHEEQEQGNDDLKEKTKAAANYEFKSLTIDPKTHKHRNFAKMRKKGIYIPEPYSLYEDITVTDEDINETETYCSGLRYEFIEKSTFDDFNSTESSVYIFEVCHTLCKAVDCINKSGFYHMDLNERNFIFDKHGHAWLVDFTGGFVVNHSILKADGYEIIGDPIAINAFKKSEIKTGLDCEKIQAYLMVEFLKKKLGTDDIFSEIVLTKIYNRDTPMKDLMKEVRKKCSFTYRLRSFR